MKFIIMVLYALVLFLIAFLCSKKSTTQNDFLLGGRKSGPWISAFAYGTTYFSAVIFVGYAGKFGWNMGISSALIGLGNALVGSFLAWKVLAKRTRRMTHEMGASTMPGFFEARYGSKAMKMFAAVVIFVFLVPYCASVYQGISHLFESVFDIPFTYCVIGIAVLTALYLAAGGYFASVWVDFFQGMIMLSGIALMVFFVFRTQQVGGIAQGLARLKEIDPVLVGLPQGKNLLTLVSIVVLTSLGSWGLPQMVHKFYAVRDDNAIQKGAIISTGFALIIGLGAYLTGSVARLVLDNTMPVDAAGAANTDMIIPSMLNNALPEILLAIIVVLVLSASMSTLSSLVLVSSSAVAVDLLKGGAMPNMKDKSVVSTMRLLCVVFAAVSVVIALIRFSAIVTLMSFSWGTIAGTFLGAYVFGLFDKQSNRYGAWAGMLLGFGVNIIGAILYGFDGSVAPILGCISMFVSLAAVPVASRVANVLRIRASAKASA